MALYATAILSFVKGLIQGNQGCDSQRPSAFIHVLEDDSLLNIFLLCRPVDNEEDAVEILGGRKCNDDERWWYRLAQVCRRWRNLVLESASLLGLSLLCTYGTPVADVLAHFPPLPLILDYSDLYTSITPDDELGIKIALEQHRDRVHRIRIMQPVGMLLKFLKALDGEFPNLEFLFVERHTFYTRPPRLQNIPNVCIGHCIPETFRAPRLRYFVVMGFPIPITFPLFTTTMGNLVALSLSFDLPWEYFYPNPLLQLSLMPQLETSRNTSNVYFPNDDMETKLFRRMLMRHFGLGATFRLLEGLQLYIVNRLRTSLTTLPKRRLLSSAETGFRLRTVKLTFLRDSLRMDASTHGPDSAFKMYRFSMSQGGRNLDQQLASVTKFFRTLMVVFSPVENLIFRYDLLPLTTPSEPDRIDEADPTRWHELFRAFGNLKGLYMDQGLVGQLTRVFQPEGLGEEPSTMVLLLPELRELGYAIMDHPELYDRNHTLFAQFASARRSAGRPVKILEAVIPLEWSRN